MTDKHTDGRQTDSACSEILTEIRDNQYHQSLPPPGTLTQA